MTHCRSPHHAPFQQKNIQGREHAEPRPRRSVPGAVSRQVDVQGTNSARHAAASFLCPSIMPLSFNSAPCTSTFSSCYEYTAIIELKRAMSFVHIDRHWCKMHQAGKISTARTDTGDVGSSRNCSTSPQNKPVVFCGVPSDYMPWQSIKPPKTNVTAVAVVSDSS